jgi:hypothetical protein
MCWKVRMRRALAGWTAAAVSGLVLLVLGTPPASAKSYDLSSAKVVMTVRPDGSLVVTEDITFRFSGSFSGAERSIPVRSFERLDSVTVSENGQAYRPGASTATGSSGDAGTFGAVLEGDREHVVWHYAATDQTRTFRISYQLRGAALAYDDVVEVSEQVWGSEWPSKLGRLEAILVLPGQAGGPMLRGWGHPGSVDGTVDLGTDRIVLNASNVPSGRAVELHATFPRGLLTSTAGARTHPGPGMDAVLATERELTRGDDVAPLSLIPALLSVGVGGAVGLVVLLGLYLGFGKDRGGSGRRGPASAVVSTPPDDLPPALVPSLLQEDHLIGNRELTATILDLIRRGVVVVEKVAAPRASKDGATGDRVGMGDLRVVGIRANASQLASFEAAAVRLLQRPLMDGGPFKLSQLPSLLARNRPRGRAARDAFLLQVRRAVEKRNWYDRRGRRVLGKLRSLSLVLIPVAPAVGYWRAGPPGAVDGLLGALACWLALEVGGARRGLTTRRTPHAAAAARGWRAYRRHLERLQTMDGDSALEGPDAWNQLLTYAVALGLSDEVLRVAAAHPAWRGSAGQYRYLEEGITFSFAWNSAMLNDAAWNRLGGVPVIHASDPRYSAGAAGGVGGGLGGGLGGGAGGGDAGGGGGGGAW